MTTQWKQDGKLIGGETTPGQTPDDWRVWIKNTDNGSQQMLVQMGHQVGDRAAAQHIIARILDGLNRT